MNPNGQKKTSSSADKEQRSDPSDESSLIHERQRRRHSSLSTTISQDSQKTLPYSKSGVSLEKNLEKLSFHEIPKDIQSLSDSYFVRYTLPEIRRLQSTLQDDVETYKTQLRERISHLYEDVIKASGHLNEMFIVAKKTTSLWKESVDTFSQLSQPISTSSSGPSLVHTRWQDKEFLESLEMKQQLRLSIDQCYALRTLPEKMHRWIAIEHRYRDSALLCLWLLSIQEAVLGASKGSSQLVEKIKVKTKKSFEHLWEHQVRQMWFPAIMTSLESALTDVEKSLEERVQVAACYMIVKPTIHANHLWNRMLELRLMRLSDEFSKNLEDPRWSSVPVTEFLMDHLVNKVLAIMNQSYDVIERLPGVALEVMRQWDSNYLRNYFELHMDRRLLSLIDNIDMSQQSSVLDVLHWTMLPSASKTLFKDWLEKTKTQVSQQVLCYLRAQCMDVQRLSQAQTNLMKTLREDPRLCREWMTLLQKHLNGEKKDRFVLWSFFFEDAFRQHAEFLIEKHWRTKEIQKLFDDIASYPIEAIKNELQLSTQEKQQDRFTETSVHLLESHVTTVYTVTCQLKISSLSTHPISTLIKEEHSFLFWEGIADPWSLGGDLDLLFSKTTTGTYEKALSRKFSMELRKWIVELIDLLQKKRFSCDTASMTVSCLWNIRFISKLLLKCPILERLIVYRQSEMDLAGDQEDRVSLFQLLEEAHTDWLTNYLKLVLYPRLTCKEEGGEYNLQKLHPVLKKSEATITTIADIDRFSSMEISEFLKSLLDELTCLLRSELGETPFVQRTREGVSRHFILAACEFYQAAIETSLTEYVYAVIYHDLCLLNETFPCEELKCLIRESSSKLDLLNRSALDRQLSQRNSDMGHGQNNVTALMSYNPLIYSLFFNPASSNTMTKMSRFFTPTLIDSFHETTQRTDFDFPLLPVAYEEVEETHEDPFLLGKTPQIPEFQLPPLELVSSSSTTRRKNHTTLLHKEEPLKSIITKDITKKPWNFVEHVGQKAASSRNILSSATQFLSSFSQTGTVSHPTSATSLNPPSSTFFDDIHF